MASSSSESNHGSACGFSSDHEKAATAIDNFYGSNQSALLLLSASAPSAAVAECRVLNAEC
jgi:hypothetical protein